VASEPFNAAQRMPSKPDPEVLDLAHLSRYSMGDRALEAELLSLFRAQVRIQASAIALADGAESWKFATHTLKGVARTIGAWRIARTATALETLGFDGPPEERTALMSQLEEQIAECEAAIDGTG
jgi:HPt (histidine-containing phosphotransfer) domain-containing protein